MPAGTKLIAGNKPVSFVTAQQLQQLQQQGQATQVSILAINLHYSHIHWHLVSEPSLWETFKWFIFFPPFYRFVSRLSQHSNCSSTQHPAPLNLQCPLWWCPLPPQPKQPLTHSDAIMSPSTILWNASVCQNFGTVWNIGSQWTRSCCQVQYRVCWKGREPPQI